MRPAPVALGANGDASRIASIDRSNNRKRGEYILVHARGYNRVGVQPVVIITRHNIIVAVDAAHLWERRLSHHYATIVGSDSDTSFGSCYKSS